MMPRLLGRAAVAFAAAGALASAPVVHAHAHCTLVPASLEVQVDRSLSDHALLEQWLHEQLEPALTEAGVVLGSDAPAYRFSVQIGGTDYDYVVRVRREGNEPVSIEARCACTKSDVVAFAVDKVMESSTGLASSTSPPVVDVDSEVQPVPDEETAPRDRAARVGPLGVTGIVVMIGGAAAMVAGGVMLGRGERESLVGDDDERVRIDDLRPAGRAALGVGAGALAVGVVFVVLDQTVSKRRRRAVSLAPDVGPRGLALRLTGRF